MMWRKRSNSTRRSVTMIITNLTEMREKVPELAAKRLHFFIGVDRTKEGWEGLIEAQEALPDDVHETHLPLPSKTSRKSGRHSHPIPSSRLLERIIAG